jgi:hypothetical protein
MIKRSTGFFKIAFFIFALFIGLFLILFSLTDIRNYVTTEVCIFAFCVSITIIPLILELIVYSFGVLIKGIKVSSKEEVLKYQPMKNSQVPYAAINDNGVEKMMFFCEKGKIALLSATNTKIHWGSEKDEIIMKTKFGECTSVFKSIYGTKYENVECIVYTTLTNENISEKEDVTSSEAPSTQESKKEAKKEKRKDNKKKLNQQQTTSMPVNENCLSSTQSSTSIPNIQRPVAPPYQQNPANIPNQFNNYPNPNLSNNSLGNIQKFDYALDDSDMLIEETIKL